MHPSEQTVAFRVYWQGQDFLGTATIELPEVGYITETLNGAGIAGEIESPVMGLTQSMSVTLAFTSATHQPFNTLDWTKQPLFECYSALQVADPSTGVRDSVPYRVNIVGRPKSLSLGSLEQGKKHGNEEELEVTRLEIFLDDEEKLVIDKLQFIHRVNGTDLLAKARQQMGLNV